MIPRARKVRGRAAAARDVIVAWP